MFDLSIFTTPEAWISLITLLFLEIVLGVDNLVFIAITTDRLPAEKQHLGRKIGLLGALFMRILFLCFASFLVHMTTPVFTISFIEIHGEPMGFSVRDLVLLAGGIYLIYKGIDEIRSVLNLTEEKEQHEPEVHRSAITLPQAVITIMIMAVVLMMVFIDAISNFINQHTEIKILALVFIVMIGILLTLDGLGINSGIEILDMHLEKLMVYFAMVFSIILELIQMKYKKNYQMWVARKNREIHSTEDQH